MARYPSDRDEDRREATRYPYATRAKVRAGGREHEGITFDVSMDGIYLRLDEPPETNQVVAVEVFLGRSSHPVEWMGRITRAVKLDDASPEQPAGVAIKILGIDDKERVRWIDVLARASQGAEEAFGPLQDRSDGPDAAETPRRDVRYRTPLQIDVRDMRRLLRLVSKDISAGGVFVRTKEKIDPGTAVAISIRHPVSGAQFAIKGRVSRVQNDGLAIEFTSLSVAQKKELQRFIVTGRPPGENT